MDRLEKDVLMTSETVGLFVSQICNELSHPLIAFFFLRASFLFVPHRAP